MDIKILGSGSSGNCYRVRDGVSSLLLDAGLPFKKIQQGIDFKVSELSGVLVTHEHGDHSKAVKDLLAFGVDCFMSEGTAKALGINNPLLRAIKANGNSQIRLGTFTILPFRVQHDAAEPLGFLVRSNHTGETLLYATDTCYLKYRFAGLTHIILEVNHCRDLLDENVKAGLVDQTLRNRIISNHLALQTALEFFRANDLSKVQEIILVHISNNNAHAEKILREVQKCTGKVVTIA